MPALEGGSRKKVPQLSLSKNHSEEYKEGVRQKPQQAGRCPLILKTPLFSCKN